MKVKIKKLHPDAIIPSYAKDGDAGLDLTAVTSEISTTQIKYGTGLAIQIPKGYVGLIYPRSSIYKYSLSLSNCVGVIDSGYTGEISFVFNSHEKTTNWYQHGDRIGQLIIMPYPQIEFEEVAELSETARGSSGYGSSGK